MPNASVTLALQCVFVRHVLHFFVPARKRDVVLHIIEMFTMHGSHVERGHLIHQHECLRIASARKTRPRHIELRVLALRPKDVAVCADEFELRH
jgi:hypothetical protein